MKELFVVWLLAAMNMMAPAHRQHFVAEARESFAQADDRYREIATAIVNVSFDPAEKPLFGGSMGRSHTALFIAHKFWMESGFRRDVQTGVGREKYASTGLNDHGRSWCLGQLNLGMHLVQRGPGKWEYDSVTTTEEGWTGRELLADIQKCVRASLHVMHRSFASCPQLGPEGRLTVYAAGKCDSAEGLEISKTRFRSYSRWWTRALGTHPGKKDVDFFRWQEGERNAVAAGPVSVTGI